MRVLFLVVFLVLSSYGFSQPYSWYKKQKPYTWMFGVGYSAIDDDGRGFCQPFDFQQSWNYLVYPTKLTVNRYLKSGFSLEFEGAFNTYTTTKLINDTIGFSGNVITTNIQLDYSFAELLQPKWFEPFVELGVGMTQRTAFSDPYCMTGNLSFGMNFWLFKGFGIQLQTSGRFALVPFDAVGPNAYTQHSASLLYRIEPKKQGYRQSSRKKYKWTKKRQKYKSSKGNK